MFFNASIQLHSPEILFPLSLLRSGIITVSKKKISINPHLTFRRPTKSASADDVIGAMGLSVCALSRKVPLRKRVSTAAALLLYFIPRTCAYAPLYTIWVYTHIRDYLHIHTIFALSRSYYKYIRCSKGIALSGIVVDYTFVSIPLFFETFPKKSSQERVSVDSKKKQRGGSQVHLDPLVFLLHLQQQQWWLFISLSSHFSSRFPLSAEEGVGGEGERAMR